MHYRCHASSSQTSHFHLAVRRVCSVSGTRIPLALSVEQCVFACASLRLSALVAILPGARDPSPSKQVLTGHSLGPTASSGPPPNISLGSLGVKGYHLHQTHTHTLIQITVTLTLL